MTRNKPAGDETRQVWGARKKEKRKAFDVRKNKSVPLKEAFRSNEGLCRKVCSHRRKKADVTTRPEWKHVLHVQTDLLTCNPTGRPHKYLFARNYTRHYENSPTSTLSAFFFRNKEAKTTSPREVELKSINPVSYTHLTLPTTRMV